MKPKLPKPFYTARVGEALSSLTNYVREARRIADEIKPVLSSDSPLQPDPDAVPRAPKLQHVGIRPGVKPTPNLLPIHVTGQYLKHVQSFALIPTDDLSDGAYSLPAHLLHINPTGRFIHRDFTMDPDFTNPVPPSGLGRNKNHYHAWVQDSFGQEDLLFNALAI